MKLIPLSRPEITREDKAAVLGVLNTPYLALGPKLQEFEQNIAKYVGRKYAVAVNSGTSALHLIIKSLGIGKGSTYAPPSSKTSDGQSKATADKDEVITTPFSFIASANCALFEGAKPVFADIDPETLAIDPDLIKKKITKRTKAILAVDVFGHPADWDAILRIARRHKLYVIEDSAEAIGSKYKGKQCGSFGDAAILSFYPNKQITTGEGGVLLTDNKRIAELALSMRNQGREIRIQHGSSKTFSHKSILEHTRLGYNYRISDIVCAAGVSQLKRLKKTIKKRMAVAKTYNMFLRDAPGVVIPYEAKWAKVNPFVYVIRLADSYSKKDRDMVIRELKESGIQASNYFPCIHLQPFYKKMFGYKKGDFPVAEYISDRTIALPFYNNLSISDIDIVTKNLKRIISQ